MNKIYSALATALVLTGACATSSAPLDLSAAIDAPASWAMDEAETAPIQSGWLEAFDDTALKALVAEALVANPDLGAAQGRLNRARAVLAQSRAAQGPSVSVSATGSVSEGFDGGDDTRSYGTALSASWEADLWGRLASNKTASARAANAAEFDFKATQQLIAASTAQAYFLLIEANQLAEVERSNLESLEETLGFVSIQFERGLRSSEDIALIRADVETSRASLDFSEQAQRNAARAIEILVGRYPAAHLNAGATAPDRPHRVGAQSCPCGPRPGGFSAS